MIWSITCEPREPEARGDKFETPISSNCGLLHARN